MADRPILFSGSMVRALLEGRKTQTRRVLKSQPSGDHGLRFSNLKSRAAIFRNGPHGLRQDIRLRYQAGDRLYVREAWRTLVAHDADPPRDLPPYMTKVAYEADGRKPHGWVWGKLRPGMHMPRWASRITLIVTDVRVERLQEISEADAWAEGAPKHGASRVPMEVDERGYGSGWRTARSWFDSLWDSLNADRGYSWAANPWVVAVSFSVERRNIDDV